MRLNVKPSHLLKYSTAAAILIVYLMDSCNITHDLINEEWYNVLTSRIEHYTFSYVNAHIIE